MSAADANPFILRQLLFSGTRAASAARAAAAGRALQTLKAQGFRFGTSRWHGPSTDSPALSTLWKFTSLPWLEGQEAHSSIQYSLVCYPKVMSEFPVLETSVVKAPSQFSKYSMSFFLFCIGIIGELVIGWRVAQQPDLNEQLLSSMQRTIISSWRSRGRRRWKSPWPQHA